MACSLRDTGFHHSYPRIMQSGLPTPVWTAGKDETLFTESQLNSMLARQETLGLLAIVPIPYAITLLGVNFAGYVGINTNSPADSYTEGAFAGLVVDTYFINRRHVQVCSSGVGIKACVKIDLQKSKLIGKIYYRKIRCDAWPPSCSGVWEKAIEETLASW